MGAGFTSLDMMVLVSLAVAGGFGAMRGFVTEVFLLAAWIAGIVAVKLLHAMATAMLVKPVGSEGGASILAVTLVFGLTFLSIRLIGNRLGRSTRGSLLGPFDRVLGLGFGMIKGLLAATLAFLLMVQVYDIINGRDAARPDWMLKSRTYDLLRASSTALVSAVEAGRAP
jgi:membrane protein required for colicin V production